MKNPLLELLQEDEYYAAKYSDSNELLIGRELNTDVKLVRYACKYVNEQFGICSMIISIYIDFYSSTAAEIPRYLWKVLPYERFKEAKIKKEQDVYIFTHEKLEDILKLAISDIFADNSYTLEDVKSYKTEDILALLRDTLKMYKKQLEIVQVADLHFSTVEEDRSRSYSEELQRLKHEQHKKEITGQYDVVFEEIRKVQSGLELLKEQSMKETSETNNRAKQTTAEIQKLALLVTDASQNLQAINKKIETLEAEKSSKADESMATIMGDLQKLAESVKAVQSNQTDTSEALNKVFSSIQLAAGSISNQNALKQETIYEKLQEEYLDGKPNFTQSVVTKLKENASPEQRFEIQQISIRAEFMRFIREKILEQKADETSLHLDLLLKGGTVIKPDGQASSMRSRGTYATTLVQIGDLYKLRMRIPGRGYIWLFHISRKFADKIRVMYPFWDDIVYGNPQLASPYPIEILFPDFLSKKAGFMEQTASGAGEGYDRDAFLIIYSEKVLNIFTKDIFPTSLPLESHMGFSSHLAQDHCYLNLEELKHLDLSEWECAMIEYKTEG